MNSTATGTVWTILDLLNWTTGYFEDRGIDSPRMTAEILLASALETERISLYLQYDKPLTGEELGRFKALIRRRANREPVAYILGRKAFWNLDLTVTPATLIPRPETERLVEAALRYLDGRSEDRTDVLELGTGSGAVILAVAAELPAIRCTASDRSTDALTTARANAARAALGDRIDFFAGDWFDAVKGSSAFDLILSNPPYIPSGDIDRLQPEIHRFEPRLALDGGPEGLDCLAHLITSAPKHLKPGGMLLLEIGCEQRRTLTRMAADSGNYRHIDCLTDYSGLDRVLALAAK